MTRIIGFAGKKQSGKDTCSRCVMSTELQKAGVCKHAGINSKGDIIVTDIFGEKFPDLDWVPLSAEYVNVDALWNDFKECRIYALATALKVMLMELLRIDPLTLYGSDQDKNELTHLLWEDMPGITTVATPQAPVDAQGAEVLNQYYKEVFDGIQYHERGPMTAREVMQYVGTEIFRKIYEPVWINALLNQINNDNCKCAVVSDLRFDDEIIAIKEAGGTIIGLTRDIYKSQDPHKSECINFDLCDHIIDNQNMSIGEQSEHLYKLLKKI